MTTYRITGGIFFILMGLSLALGVASLGVITGVFGLIAGIALIAGL